MVPNVLNLILSKLQLREKIVIKNETRIYPNRKNVAEENHRHDRATSCPNTILQIDFFHSIE